MKQQIKIQYGFQKCIGIIDDTVIVLNNRPLQYGDSYWCRKKYYVIITQVMCNNNCRFTCVYGD